MIDSRTLGLSNNKTSEKKITGEIIECVGPDILTFKEIIIKLLNSIDKKRLLIPLPLPIAKIIVKILEKIPKPLITTDQLNLLKYDNILSGKYKTNLDSIRIEQSKLKGHTQSFYLNVTKNTVQNGINYLNTSLNRIEETIGLLNSETNKSINKIEYPSMVRFTFGNEITDILQEKIKNEEDRNALLKYHETNNYLYDFQINLTDPIENQDEDHNDKCPKVKEVNQKQ